jgi:hypothetical protein
MKVLVTGNSFTPNYSENALYPFAPTRQYKKAPVLRQGLLSGVSED